MIGLLLVIHFVADFLFQSREMGKKKSSEFPWLLKHLSIQFIFFFAALIPFASIPILTILLFALMNAAIHGVIDWNIWRLYKLGAFWRIKKDPQHPLLTDSVPEKWKYWEDHWFYTTIGFDQLLHGLTLVFLAWWLL
jgi:hypothetical protein